MDMDDRVILITGGTGSLGRRLAKRILEKWRPRKVIIFSRDEYKQALMQQEFANGRLRFFLGDIRDKERPARAFEGVDYVIHAAALKRIPALEYNPMEAVRTNILGSKNIIETCLDKRVKKCILTSTDKAVCPVNLYGATKLAAEKLFMAANAYAGTKFSCVRYGNVINSRGSVIELFLKLKDNGPFPITHPEMTRFWITLDEAVDLVFVALKDQRVGIFVPKPKAMSILEVATAINPDQETEIIGIRPGEKMHEVLVSEDNEAVFAPTSDLKEYNSATAEKLTREEFLYKLNGVYAEG